MQYNQAPTGERTPLPRPGVDTGMGLERIASVLQDVPTNYDTDLFLPILDGLQHEILGESDAERAAHTIAYRVLADHGRAMTFLVSDGVLPGNEGRGYVLRMVMRRALRYARQMRGDAAARAPLTAAPLLPRVADLVIRRMARAYPELERQRAHIHEVLAAEEGRFERTLDAGLERLDALIGETRARGLRALPGAEVFRLYDTYGFPPDLTRDVAREHGLELDDAGFDDEMARQRERSRGAVAFRFDAPDRSLYAELRDEVGETVFVGYDALEADARVVALIAVGRRVDAVEQGQDVDVVVDRTPFYAESGGQVGDTGEMRAPGGAVAVTDTQRPVPGLWVHRGRVTHGRCARRRCRASHGGRRAPERHQTQPHRDAPAAPGAPGGARRARPPGRLAGGAGPAPLRFCAFGRGGAVGAGADRGSRQRADRRGASGRRPP